MKFPDTFFGITKKSTFYFLTFIKKFKNRKMILKNSKYRPDFLPENGYMLNDWIKYSSRKVVNDQNKINVILKPYRGVINDYTLYY